jgi:AcrR family transcriptional regulator
MDLGLDNMPRKTDKRARLIDAAKVLIHRLGFHLTTLADIAQEADVPLGNVYYYFKTKAAIGEAVIEKRAAEIVEYLLRLEENPDPFARLLSMLDFKIEELELIARYGCPVGGLCQELGKQGGPLAAKLLHDQINWAEIQFKAMGLGDKSADYALHLVSSVQGIFLLTHTFKDPKLVSRQAVAVQEWLERVVEPAEAV